MILVPQANRNSGRGTQALQALTRYADQHGQMLVLSPARRNKKMGTTSRLRLVRFYRRFGFGPNKGPDRPPQLKALPYYLLVRYPACVEIAEQVYKDK